MCTVCMSVTEEKREGNEVEKTHGERNTAGKKRQN